MSGTIRPQSFRFNYSRNNLNQSINVQKTRVSTAMKYRNIQTSSMVAPASNSRNGLEFQTLNRTENDKIVYKKQDKVFRTGVTSIDTSS